ncbi:porin family protein [Hyunsoonleella ulvae]|uniref:porin family protein n=1 Tax=Hyunsoonleella ulvae TaxID=2799948 RepID=UPI00193A8908|nr:porin family protein [Hyunsoonleella ulvae]
MRKFLCLIPLLSFLNLFAQEDRLGISVGATNYITDASWLFSKSGTGYTFGVVATREFTERSALFIEINYSKHFVKFIGRETETSNPEDIKFNLERFSVPFFYNYSYLIKNDFKFGVTIGPSFEFYHDYRVVDESKEEYLLDPLYVAAQRLQFDSLSTDDTISFNLYASLGLNVQYQENFMVSLRYYYGITDPYRRALDVSPVVDIEGQDSYFTFTVSYFFN